MRALLAAALIVLAPAVAHGQACPPTPANYRPHVDGGAYAAPTILPAGGTLRLGVWLSLVHCSYGSGPPPPRAAELRAVVRSGPRAGAELPVRGNPGEVKLVLAEPGAYQIEIHSRTHPQLDPLVVRARVIDPARAATTRLRMSFPRERRLPARLAVRVIDGDGLAMTVTAVRRGKLHEAAITVEPGSYRLAAGIGRGTATREVQVALGASAVDAVFAGSHLAIDLDGLPADGRVFDVVVEYADRTRARRDLGETGADLGDDAPPGPAIVRLRGAPRIDPYDPDREPWQVVRSIPIEVPGAGALTLRWSTPALLAGVDPRARAWTAVPGGGARAASAPPAEASFLAFRGGRAVVLGASLWEHAAGWERWAVPADLGWMTGPEQRAAMLDPDTWAAVDGGTSVLVRTRQGLDRETLPTYASGAVYPCYTTDVAVDGRGTLVVVGRCRPNAPEGDAWVPHQGFVAVRGAERWTVARGFAPLRAVAAAGDRVVAVGDGGAVVVRTASGWSEQKHGGDALVGVAIAGDRIVARTAGGSLVDVAGKGTPRVIHERRDRGRLLPVADHCLAGGRWVAWHRPVEFIDSGAPGLPELVIVEDGAGEREVHRSATGTVAAIACDGDTAWMLVRDGKRLALKKIAM